MVLRVEHRTIPEMMTSNSLVEEEVLLAHYARLHLLILMKLFGR